MSKILIVDDDPVMRKLLAKAVSRLDAVVFLASDGIHALDALRCNNDFDLILTDISMPVLDGRQLITTVKGDPKMSHIPILIMSGVVRMKDIADLLDLGATKFIPKPFNMKTLREDIVRTLETSKEKEKETIS
ncbi:MAG: response regulator [bacterium]|nr:response regulator [bacterium]